MIDRYLAIVDYGMGNLFSVKRACEYFGLKAQITSEKAKIQDAHALILPGVGAFGDAMDTLKKLDLISVIKEAILSGKPFLGICLGMQLLMTESFEFGHHQGLDIIKGSVRRLKSPVEDSGRILKVPQVGWNRIYRSELCHFECWSDTLLEYNQDGDFLYFVHSFYVVPQDTSLTISLSRYGGIEFCSSFQYHNVFACQFHPERSGREGLKIYRKLGELVQKQK